MRKITIFHGDPDRSPPTDEVQGAVELPGCWLPLGTKVAVGDVLEIPRRGRPATRKIVTGLNEGQNMIHVAWTSYSERPAAHQRCLESLTHLHGELRLAVSGLFADAHYSQAVFEATKLLENRVRAQSGLDAIGQKLMGKAFDGVPALIDLRRWDGTSGADEQDGLRFIFMGTMQAIRNPRGHELADSLDPQEALEHLSLVSLLLRRLDTARAAGKTVQVAQMDLDA